MTMKMKKKPDGFLPMEFEMESPMSSADRFPSSSHTFLALGQGSSLQEYRSNRSHSYATGRYSKRDSKCSKWTLSVLLILSVVLIILATLLYKAEESALWGSGLFPDNNTDEWLPSDDKNTTSNDSFQSPPVARRDVDRMVQVGIPPLDWDPDLPRQSTESSNALMDPPQLVPDPYGWLRDDDRSNFEVLQYLHAENNYTQARLHHLQSLRDSLYQEMIGYMEETSHTFPVLKKSFFYYSRTVQGKAYPLYCRAPKPTFNNGLLETDGNEEEDDDFNGGVYLQQHLTAWDDASGNQDMPILPMEYIYLDQNVLSIGHDFFGIGCVAISPSEELIAYTVDIHGNEIYQLTIARVDTGEVLFPIGNADTTLQVTDYLVWTKDDNTLFYGKGDDAQRTFQVYQWNRSTNTEILLYEELDVTFWVGFDLSQDERYLLIESASSETSEIYYLDLMSGAPQVESIAERLPDVLYEAEHLGGYWWILSNSNDPEEDMQLWTTPVGQDDGNWTRVLAPAGDNEPLLEGIPIESFTVFHHPTDQFYVVVEGREHGMRQVWVLQVNADATVARVDRLDFNDDSAATVTMASNPSFDTSRIFINYVSLVTPPRLIQIDLEDPSNLERQLIVYETSVPGYQKDRYGSQQVQVLSRDGETHIPVSLVYLQSAFSKLSTQGDPVPIHLYAYGAYGESIDDTFSSSRLPLLDRGIIYAIAHVRGGGELGRKWYLDGKLLHKHNTFDDFVDVARFLINDKRWTTPDMLSCEGRSAGGLTIGASLNQAPELFRVAILGVPFVDLIVTMMDASIPLTTGEWEEWGNPNEAEFFDAMMEYSPMNNVRETMYPSMLVLAGLFDPRVAYWEPAKFTATLRHTAVAHEDRPICLKTDMTSGHFSASDRYKYLEGKAFDFAFLLDQLGVT